MLPSHNAGAVLAARGLHRRRGHIPHPRNHIPRRHLRRARRQVLAVLAPVAHHIRHRHALLHRLPPAVRLAGHAPVAQVRFLAGHARLRLPR